MIPWEDKRPKYTGVGTDSTLLKSSRDQYWGPDCKRRKEVIPHVCLRMDTYIQLVHSMNFLRRVSSEKCRMRKVRATEKAMAPHSSTLAWKISWTEEPDRLQSMGSLGVGHDWATSLSLFTFLHWRRKWQPTPVFLPGESQGRGSLVGCHLWGRTESDMTEAT